MKYPVYLKAALTCLLLSLVGCATQPISVSEYKPVPPVRVFQASYVQAKEGLAIVEFRRDPGFMGGGAYFQLSVDGTLVAEIDHGEILKLWVTQGVHKFSVIPTPIVFNASRRREIEMDVKPNRTNAIRLGFGQDGPIFQPLTY